MTLLWIGVVLGLMAGIADVYARRERARLDGWKARRRLEEDRAAYAEWLRAERAAGR